jgi:hypothetical protein
LAVHIQRLRVDTSHDDGRCQNGDGDRTMEGVYAMESHILFL